MEEKLEKLMKRLDKSLSKDKIIKFEFLCILFLICFYNIDKIENAVHVLVKLFRLLKEFILALLA